MPPLPATPQVIKFRLLGDADGQNIDNVFHAHYTGGAPSNADMQLLSDAVLSAFTTRLVPHLGVEYTVRECVAQDLTSSSGAGASSETPAAGGDASGDKMPPSLALVVSWKIARRYRGGKPRTYLAPIRSDHFDTPVTFNSAYAATVSSAAASFRTDIATFTAGTTSLDALGCVSYFSAKTLRSAGLFEAFIDENVDLRPGHQRRRDGKLNVVRTP